MSTGTGRQPPRVFRLPPAVGLANQLPASGGFKAGVGHPGVRSFGCSNNCTHSYAIGLVRPCRSHGLESRGPGLVPTILCASLFEYAASARQWSGGDSSTAASPSGLRSNAEVLQAQMSPGDSLL
jgi:hypothetical protein